MTYLGIFRNDYYDPSSILPEAQYGASTQNGGVISAALLAGARKNVAAFSGQAAAQALTTDSAVNIIQQVQNALVKAAGTQTLPSILGMSFLVRLINNDTTSGVITLTGGAGVTINGTNTLAITTSREFLVTITSATTVSFQNVGSGTP